MGKTASVAEKNWSDVFGKVAIVITTLPDCSSADQLATDSVLSTFKTMCQ